MRGEDRRNGCLFIYVNLEDQVPKAHPPRIIREIANDVLEGLAADFEASSSHTGRPSIPPEKLLRALLLQAFYTIRPERQLMEQLNFNILFHWFVGLGMDDIVWDARSFAKNRDRLLKAEVSRKLLKGVVEHKKVRRLLSREGRPLSKEIPQFSAVHIRRAKASTPCGSVGPTSATTWAAPAGFFWMCARGGIQRRDGHRSA